jgi:thiamine-monophosphate kinase
MIRLAGTEVKSEAKLIAAIRQRSAKKSPFVRVGVGDDATVLRVGRGKEILVTTDFSIEGTHFRREWHPARSVGHRCLARGISDIAAMGGEPRAALLSLALPADLEHGWIDEFLTGLLALAKKYKLVLAGGDIAQAPQVAADIVVIGETSAGRALLRSGAKAGDSIYVTGELGTAAAVLQALRDGRKISSAEMRKEAVRHFFPEPRVEVGRFLRQKQLATAAIDISDGLSTDLSHICQESGVGALLHEHSIPRSVWRAGTGFQSSALNFHSSALHWALHGGDDYELLFTSPARAKIPARIGRVPVRRIGEIVSDRQHRIFLVDSHGQRKELTPGGWQHFS